MAELSEDTIEEVTRLTRLARDAIDDDEADAYRDHRDELLEERGYVARVREEDDTLVCYPAEWVEDGTVQFDRIDDTDRAVERSLSGGGGDADWASVEGRNAELVAAVESEHGDVHAANARAFADFMGNHYARPIETAGRDEIAEFLTEYYPRNAWPSEKQRAVVEESLRLLFDAADAEMPTLRQSRRR